MTDGAITRVRANRRIVLIGSMSVYSTIVDLAGELANWEIQTVIPEAENEAVQRLSLQEFEQFKRRVSFAHLKKIRDPRTYAVLAINPDRHGIMNYVGPNTFAEIAVAFAQSKRIYLYQGMPEAYADELSAWGAVVLNRQLDRLIAAFQQACLEEDMQLRLLD